MRSDLLLGAVSSDTLPELATQRRNWRDKLIGLIRVVAAILSALGFGTVQLVLPSQQHFIPTLCYVALFLVSVVPGIRPLPRAWLLAMGLPGTCIAAIAEFGLAPNIFCGLLFGIVCVRLIFNSRRTMIVAVTLMVALFSMGAVLVSGRMKVGPSWVMTLDPSVPANVIRVFFIFAMESVAVLAVLGYVLRSIESLLMEKAAAVESLRRESTAKEKLRQELAARQKADAKARELENLGRLASYFGHDTNNALQVVTTSIAILRDSPTNSAHRNEALATLEAAASQIRTLATQLRAFGPGRGQVIKGSADLPGVLGATARMLAQILPSEIEIDLQEPVAATVAMSEGELQRILINLAMNARDAMENGGKLTIRSQLGDASRADSTVAVPHVVVQVRDTGTGMSDELQQTVFEPFFTTKGDRGTGLGLSSVRESVEATGGVVRLESRVGGGTTVTLVLPRASAPAKSASRPPAVGTTVLVVEEPMVRSVLLRAFRGQGYLPHEVDSASAGLAALRAAVTPFSVLVVGSTSADETRELVQVFRTRSPSGQVILCADDESGFEADGVTTVLKPFTLPALLRRIGTCLPSERGEASAAPSAWIPEQP
jgi:signal transduction histidine kinase